MNLKLSSSPIFIFLKEENSWKTCQVGSKRYPHITVRLRRRLFPFLFACLRHLKLTTTMYDLQTNSHMGLKSLNFLSLFYHMSMYTFLDWSVHECNTSALSLTLKFKSVLSMQISHFCMMARILLAHWPYFFCKLWTWGAKDFLPDNCAEIFGCKMSVLAALSASSVERRLKWPHETNLVSFWRLSPNIMAVSWDLITVQTLFLFASFTMLIIMKIERRSNLRIFRSAETDMNGRPPISKSLQCQCLPKLGPIKC